MNNVSGDHNDTSSPFSWGRFIRHSGMISEEGQRRISSTSVAIAGLGGIGGPVAMMLAKAGFGRLSLCDFDQYEQANTVEQLFAVADTVGKDKADVAKAEVLRHGPECHVVATNHPIRTQADANHLVADADYVISGVDNAIARILLARAAEARKIPFLVPANLGWTIFFSYRKPNDRPYEHRFTSLPVSKSNDGRLDLDDHRTMEVIQAQWDIWLALLGNYDRSTTERILLGELRSYPYMAAPAFFAASVAVNYLCRHVALPKASSLLPERFAFDMLNWCDWDWEDIFTKTGKALHVYLDGGRQALALQWPYGQESEGESQ